MTISFVRSDHRSKVFRKWDTNLPEVKSILETKSVVLQCATLKILLCASLLNCKENLQTEKQYIWFFLWK